MIPLAEPNLSGKEAEYALEAVATNWISARGPFVERFEDMVAKACGREWCVATVTGSMAIELAVTSAGLAYGMQVKMPSFSYVAAANAVHRRGASILFEDIEQDWSYDRTDLGGVIDAAPAVGVKQPGLMCCLSFNGNKTVTTGQGGAIVGNKPEFEEITRHLANHAKMDGYHYNAVGYNAGLSNLSAAVGCAQMERLKEFLEKKANIRFRYRRADIELVGDGGSNWMALAKASDRVDMIHKLRDKGIDARPFWTPLHMTDAYKVAARTLLPATTELYRKLVCLPCSTHLSEQDQSKVIEAWYGD